MAAKLPCGVERLGVEAAALLPGARVGADLFLGERTHGVLQQRALLIELEVHKGSSRAVVVAQERVLQETDVDAQASAAF
jgi:hypothetical protein